MSRNANPNTNSNNMGNTASNGASATCAEGGDDPVLYLESGSDHHHNLSGTSAAGAAASASSNARPSTSARMLSPGSVYNFDRAALTKSVHLTLGWEKSASSSSSSGGDSSNLM